MAASADGLPLGDTIVHCPGRPATPREDIFGAWARVWITVGTSIIAVVDGTDLAHQQRDSLWLDGRSGLYSVADALSFMNEVGVALRYGAAPSLPVASMYRATQRQVPVPEDEKAAHARAFELTNGLLGTGKVVEINVIAGRLA